MNEARTLRVCIDCRRGDHGGIRRITRELCRALCAERGMEVVVLAGAQGREAYPDAREILPFEAPYLSLEEHEMLPEILQKAGVDVYVTPQFYNTPHIAVPLISWVHDTWPVRHPEWLPQPEVVFGKFSSGSREVARRLMEEYTRLRTEGRLFPGNRFLEEHARSSAGMIDRAVIAMFALNLQRSVRVVTCSNHAQNDLEALFPEARDKIRVIYNPVPDLPAAAPGAHAGPPRLLHVSKWEPRKNIEGLIAAFSQVAAQIDDLELHLVGAAVTQQDKARVDAALAASPVSRRIIVHGPVSDETLAALYATSTAAVVPSLFEGFSLPMVEAMAAGIPVAAARVGAIPEIANGAAAFFDPYDVGSMSEALRKVLLDASLRADLVARGRHRVASLKPYDFRAQIAAMIAGVCGRRPDGVPF